MKQSFASLSSLLFVCCRSPSLVWLGLCAWANSSTRTLPNPRKDRRAPPPLPPCQPVPWQRTTPSRVRSVDRSHLHAEETRRPPPPAAAATQGRSTPLLQLRTVASSLRPSQHQQQPCLTLERPLPSEPPPPPTTTSTSTTIRRSSTSASSSR